jgi:glycosyltransferase involved in cell wall biosynthesis
MSARKKILFVVTKSNFGGAQRYVYDLATSLPRDEFEVAVACGGNGLLVSMLGEKNISMFTVKSFQRDISIAKEFLSLFELWELYRTFRPDVVHLNSSKAGGMGAFVARCARIPKIIFTAHGWPFWEPRNFLQKSLIAFFSWLTVLCTHTTICVSRYDMRVGERMPLVQNKVRLIRNGIAPYPLLPRDIAREKLFDAQTIADHRNDVWVLTTAELTKNKNLFIGIDAVSEHNKDSSTKIFYALIGDGEQKEQLLRHVVEKNMREQVHLLGFIPDSRTYYNGFDIFFLPSLKEGIPYVLQEAGIAGLPCVATSVGGIPEIIENGKNGFIEAPYDVAALARALKRLSNDSALRATCGENHRHKVVQDYAIENMLRETVALYA